MDGVVTQNAPRIRVLVVDSSRIHTELLAEALQKDHRLDVISAHSSAEVLDTARQHGADVAAISDYLDDTPHRGLELLRGLAEGLTNREIADQMGLSYHTIKNHVFRIFEKLGVTNRVELLFMTLSLAATPQQPPEPAVLARTERSLLTSRFIRADASTI